MTGEKLSSSEKPLSRQERTQLKQTLLEHIELQKRNLVLTNRWRELEPFIELISSAGLLIGGTELSPQQQTHLRRIAAIQTRMAPAEASGLNAQEFFAQIHAQLAQELAAYDALHEEGAKAPRAWKEAFDDFAQIELKQGAE